MYFGEIFLFSRYSLTRTEVRRTPETKRSSNIIVDDRESACNNSSNSPSSYYSCIIASNFSLTIFEVNILKSMSLIDSLENAVMNG